MTGERITDATTFLPRAGIGTVVLALLTLWLPAKTAAQLGDTAPPPLWGDLKPGPFRIGYQSILRSDPTRTWIGRSTASGDTSTIRDRPVRIGVWYPSEVKASPTMRLLDYARVPAPEGPDDAAGLLEKRERGILAQFVPPDRLEWLLSTRTMAVANAPPAKGARFPLVLYSDGPNGWVLANAILAEFLASHGYVVATVTSLGPSVSEPDQKQSPSDMEAAARDLEYASSIVKLAPYVDQSRVVTAGHSLGGTVAVMLAMRNARVRAVVGLDGTYGFDDGVASLTTYYGFSAALLRASLLDIRRSDFTTLDLSVVRSFDRSRRYLVTMPAMVHQDFKSSAPLKALVKFPPPEYTAGSGYTTAAGYRGFQRMCEITLDFLDAEVRASADARGRLTVRVQQFDGATLTEMKPGVVQR
jgi:dienelactone hydrolase